MYNILYNEIIIKESPYKKKNYQSYKYSFGQVPFLIPN